MYGGTRSPSQNSESDWLGYAFVWVTAAARRGLMALYKPLPSPGTIVGLGGGVGAGRIVQRLAAAASKD